MDDCCAAHTFCRQLFVHGSENGGRRVDFEDLELEQLEAPVPQDVANLLRDQLVDFLCEEGRRRGMQGRGKRKRGIGLFGNNSTVCVLTNRAKQVCHPGPYRQ